MPLTTLAEVGASLAGELRSERLIQAVTDASTKLTEAEFGAFFYNVTDENGVSFDKVFTINVTDAPLTDITTPATYPLNTGSDSGLIVLAKVWTAVSETDMSALRAVDKSKSRSWFRQ